MPYGLIALVGGIGLVAYYVFVTDASFISKILVAALLGFSLACLYWLGWSLLGLFLLVGLSVFILLYYACEQARYSGK